MLDVAEDLQKHQLMSSCQQTRQRSATEPEPAPTKLRVSGSAMRKRCGERDAGCEVKVDVRG